MKATPFDTFLTTFSISLCVSCLLPSRLAAASYDPAAPDYTGHRGTNI